ncbi:hypothetical protein LBMAG24_14870 [Bacteroidota bacterium]|nr:hypothetical protein LBMAG24_14870 [Bacteroidota bacterium]
MGVLHPLVIHFPIALLLLAFFLEVYGLSATGKKYKASIPLITFLGGIGAVFSALSGYFLMNQGDYEDSSVELHRNWGIALAIGSALLIGLYRFPPKIPHIHLLGQGALSILVLVTGHLGGNLTHGEDFLSFDKPKKESKQIAFNQNTLVYADIIAPIFEEKCVACHGKTKQKGKLKLDQIENVLKGGKNGFYHGSEEGKMALMSHRMRLPLSDKQHMPPKGKTQLTEKEIVIIEKWLSLGASPKLLLKDLQLTEEFVSASNEEKNMAKTVDWPSVPDLAAVSETMLTPLRDRGMVVLPLASGHPLLQINCQSLSDFSDKDGELFKGLEKNIASIRLSGTKISDKSLKWISGLPNLSKLYLDNTLITDEGIALLKNTTELRYLNLVGTSITEKGLRTLSSLPLLKSVYLYQSEVKIEDMAEIQQRMPKVYFDLGGYKIDTLTMEITTEEK